MLHVIDMVSQRTLKKEISMSGIGLHSGEPIRLRIRPALPNAGIVFVRTDLPGRPQIEASYRNVICTRLATSLGKVNTQGNVQVNIKISTVEHLLAAFHGLGIDNAIVEVQGAEIPIFDGSSAPFCEAILMAGIECQPYLRKVVALRRRIEVKLGEKWAFAEPSSSFEVYGSVDWDHPSIGYQEFHYKEGETSFAELASARTFGFLKDIEGLQKMGLAKGGSLDNAIVLDDAQILNPEGLRFQDEFARHKVLDALGDFKLSGVFLKAFIRLHRAGHDLHSQLLQEIFKNPNHYEILTVGDVRTDEHTAETTEEQEVDIHSLLAPGLIAS